jgi:hypothetical protein
LSHLPLGMALLDAIFNTLSNQDQHKRKGSGLTSLSGVEPEAERKLSNSTILGAYLDTKPLTAGELHRAPFRIDVKAQQNAYSRHPTHFGTLVVRTGQVDAAFVRVVVGQEGENS